VCRGKSERSPSGAKRNPGQMHGEESRMSASLIRATLLRGRD